MWAIGLMSGTSMDGIDAALIETDGERLLSRGPFLSQPYEPDFRAGLRAVLGEQGGEDRIAAVEAALTEIHGRAVADLLKAAGLGADRIGVVGFHGHTIAHRPEVRHTRQIGDGALLARLCGVPVVDGFRLADVAAGGQGAPLVPLYHQALARSLPRPLAVVNIGGVANITWIGADDTLLAFDTGPGNAPLDDWILRHTGRAFDDEGGLAAKGRVAGARVAAALQRPYLARLPPKSLDRDEFSAAAAEGLDAADGAATLSMITAATIAAAFDHLPTIPAQVLVAGGGRHNLFLMRLISEQLAQRNPPPPKAHAPLAIPVERVGWPGDALEAEAFAFLAVRALRGLPLTLPTTTGVSAPLTGGRLWPASG